MPHKPFFFFFCIIKKYCYTFIFFEYKYSQSVKYYLYRDEDGILFVKLNHLTVTNIYLYHCLIVINDILMVEIIIIIFLI